jgi:aconitate hydratase
MAVREVAGQLVDQVCIGSCTNSSFRDMATVGELLKGRRVHPHVSLAIAPGSQQVLDMMAQRGILATMIEAGARVLEAACGPCIGMGQAPGTNAVTLRTVNRNFEGRTGTASAMCYLCSAETAIASALSGKITDPRRLGKLPKVEEPDVYPVNDSLILRPPDDGSGVEVVRGPNIQPIPKKGVLPDRLDGVVLIKVGDNITTDHILPGGGKVLPLRSNIPAISDFLFERVDPRFAERAREHNGGFVVGGENYGQGSSREHAALAPMHLGVMAVIAKGFARIHRANLINFGILPLVFAKSSDYDRVQQDDMLIIDEVLAGLEAGRFTVKDETREFSFKVTCELSEREKVIVKAGGRLNMIPG